MVLTSFATRHWILLTTVTACLLQWSIGAEMGQPATIDTEMVMEIECGFNCTSGECLDAHKLCDGAVDCADKSDENADVCMNITSECPGYAFRCEYGACVDADARCNKKADCADLSDEKNCDVPLNITCMFRCNSGDCLDSAKVCDGAVDCPDKSDETTERCSKNLCPAFAGTCDYGACVDGDAFCDGKVDCADGSDEKNCRGQLQSCRAGQFQCGDGSCVTDTARCDGHRDCSDGSDETQNQCEIFICPSYAFRCAYGACIDGDRVCDGKPHCADGSDEVPSVCATTPRHIPCPSLKQPAHGKMDVRSHVAQFSCHTGFTLIGPDIISCHAGAWTAEPPSCSQDGNTIPGASSGSLVTMDWKILVFFVLSKLVHWL